MATKPAASTRRDAAGGAGSRRRAGRCGCCGSAASTSPPTSPRRAATRAASSSSARARSAIVKGGRVLGTPFLDISRPRHDRRRERPAVDGVRARLPRPRAASGSTTRTSRASSRSTSSARSAGTPEPRRPELAAVGDPGAASPLQPQGRPAPGGPGRDAVRRLRRRRRAAATRTRTPRTSAGCSARSSGSTRAPDGGYSIPRRQPVPEPRRARCRRSTRTAFATRTASRSTAAPAA